MEHGPCRWFDGIPYPMALLPLWDWVKSNGFFRGEWCGAQPVGSWQPLTCLARAHSGSRVQESLGLDFRKKLVSGKYFETSSVPVFSMHFLEKCQLLEKTFASHFIPDSTPTWRGTALILMWSPGWPSWGWRSGAVRLVGVMGDLGGIYGHHRAVWLGHWWSTSKLGLTSWFQHGFSLWFGMTIQ